MLQQVLSTIPDKPVKERLDARCLAYLQAHSVPAALIEVLDNCAYAGPIRIGPLWLSRLADLDQENGEEENAPCIAHGLLIVGSGLNGDPIAVELSSGQMAFISHDLLWEEDYEDFEECMVRTPLSFDDFWLEASRSSTFPRDSYDAEELWGTHSEGGETG